MRKEDVQAIKRALAILRVECLEHKSCKSCPLSTSYDCMLNKPPMHYDIEKILECFT